MSIYLIRNTYRTYLILFIQCTLCYGWRVGFVHSKCNRIRVNRLTGIESDLTYLTDKGCLTLLTYLTYLIYLTYVTYLTLLGGSYMFSPSRSANEARGDERPLCLPYSPYSPCLLTLLTHVLTC